MFKKAIFCLLGILLLPHLLCFLVSSRKIRRNICSDVDFWIEHKSLKGNTVYLSIYLLLTFPELRSVLYYRLGRFMGKFCSLILPGRRNLYIWTKDIGPSLYVGHGWSTVINANKIGKRCKVYQNVTIGSRNIKEPIIGDNVTVTAHSIVLGDILIGNNVNIGSGAVVVKSLPSNSTVVSAKSCIVRHNGNKVYQEL